MDECAKQGKRWVLGTAQLGCDYGITNFSGRVDDYELVNLMETAIELGVTALDTSPLYGDAEKRLRPWAHLFNVTTKVNIKAPEYIRLSLVKSLADMNLSQVETCLVHDWPNTDSTTAAHGVRVLEQIREEGLAVSVGVSCYTEEDLAHAADQFHKLDVVQIPINVVDQRFVSSSLAQELYARGTRFQARSILLQGLLAEWRPYTTTHQDLQRFHAYCENARVDPKIVALSFVAAVEFVSDMIIGVARSSQLRDLVEVFLDSEIPEHSMLTHLESSDPDLIDPRRW